MKSNCHEAKTLRPCGTAQYPSTIAGLNDMRHNKAVNRLNELSAETTVACNVEGLRHGVSGIIDPRDLIFWFLYNLTAFPTKIDARFR